MYVCLCKGITDRDIQREVENGARRLKDVVNKLGLAKDCAQCVTVARDVFESLKSTVREDMFYAASVPAPTAA
ncbi:bacterioferritin-associated ferredoxin [Hahella sp. CCB-MM4]|uniref:(2Fe-2S)-binding protein n=1 Tax=Hahella sp. (strain CCB-MM4) TaxID=1926491 RepID=UPI000B9C7298|nr:(2Fe-2S)-binding protein [Hahella sp. CCB-MM4]OZG75363.1 bacterioferritin-associated ferredoxin [Hahella sp. CCB-MM4]